MILLSVGDTVVHINHGVGKVIGLETREFSSGPRQFIILEVLDGGLAKKVFVPLEGSADRLRHVISKAKAEEVLAFIAFGKTSFDSGATWNRRYRDMMESVQSGDIMRVADVVVALRDAAKTKDLSFGERKLLDAATDRVRSELEAAGINTEF